MAAAARTRRHPAGRNIELGKIHIGALAGTRMMCPDPQMAAETAFHSTIGRTTGARLADGTLELTDDAGAALIRAVK